MVSRLPAWFFLGTALLLIGLALLPAMRVAFGVDQEIGMQFLTMVMLLIGGLMSGLTAMILLIRRQPVLDWSQPATTISLAGAKPALLKLHGCGLLLYSGIPLLNFLVAYWLWVNFRRSSEIIDRAGQEVLNFQIAVYLYLLLSLFMVMAGIGILTTPLLLAFHLVVTLVALLFAAQGREFNYPANIPIIKRNYTKA